MSVAQNILSFYQAVQPPNGLPRDVGILNPFQSAFELTTAFYEKYYNDSNQRIILFGINPGRFGGGLTGIPFTDPHKLQINCGIQNNLDKREELSSKFIYEMIEAYGGPKKFYAKYYISAVSPFGYIKDSKNLNYYDIKNWKDLFWDYAIQMIEKQFTIPINRKIAYSIGQGQNLKFLNQLNKERQLFDQILPLPHPRWVLQYRLKRKAEFIQQYIDLLS